MCMLPVHFETSLLLESSRELCHQCADSLGSGRGAGEFSASLVHLLPSIPLHCRLFREAGVDLLKKRNICLDMDGFAISMVFTRRNYPTPTGSPTMAKQTKL